MDDKLRIGAEAVTAGGPAFVAGATGYTGHALVRELSATGVPVIAHVRPDSPRLAEWRARFNGLGAGIDTSPWDETAVAAALARHRPSAIFALLGTTRARQQRSGVANSYERVDYGLTAVLMRAAVTAAPAARFVYLSSAGVGPRARGAYLQARWRIEAELHDSPLQWTIVRPAFITGTDREEPRPAERLAAAAVDGALRVAAVFGADALRNRYRSRTAAELAIVLARVAYSPRFANTTVGADLREIG